MKQRWIEIAEKIDSLSLRERFLVLLSLLAVVYLLWDVLLFNPIATQQTETEQALSAARQEITTMEQEAKVLRQSMSADAAAPLRRQIAEQEAVMAELDEQLAALSLGLVEADRLPVILQSVLSKTGSLQLQRLQTMPVEALDLTGTSAAGEETAAGVYKHSVRITVKGSYFQLVDYLKTLEQSDWRFYWEALDYQLEQYPRGIFQLDVYTLSTDEGLLGV